MEERKNRKPETGLTMAIDYGLDPVDIANLIQKYGKYFNFSKLSGALVCLLSISEIRERISAYKNVPGELPINFYCGGTTLEYFLKELKNGLEKFIEHMKVCGFEWVEVSNAKLDIDDKEKIKIIKRLKKEKFKVISEVGKKTLEDENHLSEEWFLKSVIAEKKAGADFIILGTGKKGRYGIFDEEGKPRKGLIKEIVRRVGLESVIFEAQDLKQQDYLIKVFGANVNLGNILTNHLFSLEGSRNGLRPGTLEVPER